MLTYSHYKALTKILREHGTTAQDYSDNRDLYEYFLSLGYVKVSNVRGYRGLEILPKGEDALLETRMRLYHFWIPTVISFIALVVSVAVAIHDIFC